MKEPNMLQTTWLGLKLAHPLIPGASPLADELDGVRRLEDAGAPAIVLRSLFEEQLAAEALHHYRYSDFHRDTYAEASSFLPDPDDFVLGPDEYLNHLRRIKEAVRVPVVASLNGTTEGGWLDIARSMERAGADALELNVYQLAADPTVSSAEVEERVLEMVRHVHGAVKIPLSVKLSPFVTGLSHFAQSLEGAGAGGLVLFNRLYQPEIDVDELEVRRSLHLSDSSELPLRVRWLAILSSQRSLTLTCSGGVHEPVDAVRALMAGAHGVQLVSALLKHGPAHLAKLVQGVRAWMKEHEFEHVDQLRGNMSLKACPDPAAYERANYMAMLQSWRH